MLHEFRRDNNIAAEDRQTVLNQLAPLIKLVDRYGALKECGVSDQLLSLYVHDAKSASTAIQLPDFDARSLRGAVCDLLHNEKLSDIDRKEMLGPLVRSQRKQLAEQAIQNLNAKELSHLTSLLYTVCESNIRESIVGESNQGESAVGDLYSRNALASRLERLVRQVYPVFKLPLGFEAELSTLPVPDRTLALRSLNDRGRLLTSVGLMDYFRQIGNDPAVRETISKRSTFNVMSTIDDGPASRAMQQLFRKAIRDFKL